MSHRKNWNFNYIHICFCFWGLKAFGYLSFFLRLKNYSNLPLGHHTLFLLKKIHILFDVSCTAGKSENNGFKKIGPIIIKTMQIGFDTTLTKIPTDFHVNKTLKIICNIYFISLLNIFLCSILPHFAVSY